MGELRWVIEGEGTRGKVRLGQVGRVGLCRW